MNRDPIFETLAAQPFEPRREGDPLGALEMAPLLVQLPAWTVIDDHHLRRQFDFDDFKSALAFVNTIGALAEEVQHHPDFELGWGKVVITLFTHDLGGLCKADFVLAARIDAAFVDASPASH